MPRTSHEDYINRMREFADAIHQAYPGDAVYGCPLETYYAARICSAAADLLEVHDATGISLDNWTGPRKLVETALRIIRASEHDFQPNGV